MNIHDLELRLLLTFREVAAHRSFGKAATALGYTQSAVSQQIARLESVIGHSLFHRPGGPRPVELTAAAEILLPRVEELVGGIHRIEDDLERLDQGAVGRIAVGTFQSVSVRLLPAIIGALGEERPDLEIELLESSRRRTLETALLERRLDVTFWVREDRDWPGFTTIPLFEDQYVVIAPADSARDSYSLADVAALPMIGQPPDDICQTRIDAGMRSHGLEPRFVFRSNDNAAVQAMVRAGNGVAVVPALAVDPSDPGVVVRPIDPPMPPRVVVVVTRVGEDRPAVQRFVEVAQRESGRLLAAA
ncbi:MAG: LysR family transcriptional regulator [Acidimicrobiia bacterium]|nr:LysR family transcriptional regulator [Acidimicrobiia bacterium]